MFFATKRLVIIVVANLSRGNEDGRPKIISHLLIHGTCSPELNQNSNEISLLIARLHCSRIKDHMKIDFYFFDKTRGKSTFFPPRKAARRTTRSNGYTSKEKLCYHEQTDKHSHTIYATHIEREQERETSKYAPTKGVALMLHLYVYSRSSFPVLKSQQFYAATKFNC